MLWLNFIHLYQPANMEQEKILEATEKSYERILRALEEHPDFKVTANIAGCLLERWATDLKRQNLLGRFKAVIKNGQLELVGSAAYHALLPLMSKKEIIAQIKEQERLLELHLGIKKIKGFFMPEMTYSREVAKIIKKIGYEWLIVDEISIFGHLGEVTSQVFVDGHSGLKVVARNRTVSESFVPDSLNDLYQAGVRGPIITATDAELYGLRHQDPTAEFEKIVKLGKIKTETISKYIRSQKTGIKVKLLDSNWQSEEIDLISKAPYLLWNDPRNIIQVNLWQLAIMAQELYYKYPRDKNKWWSRWHLWRGLASCSWWWASKKDFRAVYGPLAWNPDEVEKGVQELIKAIRSLENSTDKQTKIKAEKLAQKIRTDVWVKHWQ